MGEVNGSGWWNLMRLVGTPGKLTGKGNGLGPPVHVKKQDLFASSSTPRCLHTKILSIYEGHICNLSMTAAVEGGRLIELNGECDRC